MQGRECLHRQLLCNQQADEELRPLVSLPGWAVGPHILDEYQQVFADDELAQGSSGSTTIGNTYATDATPIAQRPQMATTNRGADTHGCCSRPGRSPRLPSRQTRYHTAMQDVMRQVVEDQMGHPTAIREPSRIEMVEKSAAVLRCNASDDKVMSSRALLTNTVTLLHSNLELESCLAFPNRDLTALAGVLSDLPF